MTSRCPLDGAAQGTRRLHVPPTAGEIRLVNQLSNLLAQEQKEAAATQLNDHCVRKEEEAFDDLSARELAETLNDDVVEHLLASRRRVALVRLLVGRALTGLRRRARSVLRREGHR